MGNEKVIITERIKKLIILFLIVLVLTLAVFFGSSVFRVFDGTFDSDYECIYDKNVSGNICP